MPHPATPGPGEGESSTVHPVLPSVNAYRTDAASSSSSSSSASPFLSSNNSSISSNNSSPGKILQPPRKRSLEERGGGGGGFTVSQLRQKADMPYTDAGAGAEVDLRVEEMRRSLGTSSQANNDPKGKQREKLTPPKGWLHFVAGGVGGMCGGIITSPLDVVKTRLQSNLFQHQANVRAAGREAAAHAARPGIVRAAGDLAWTFVETGQLIKHIAINEGPRALFKGLGPTLVGAVPARSINFFTYGNGKIILAERFNEGVETPVIHLGAAAFAGFVTATATNPIWVIKTRLQLEGSEAQKEEKVRKAAAVIKEGPMAAAKAKNFSTSSASMTASAPARASAAVTADVVGSSNGAASSKTLVEGQKFFRPARSPPRPATTSLEMIGRVWQREGLRGFYKGLSASYLGASEGVMQWVLYERLKSLAAAADKDTWAGKAMGTIGAAGTAKLSASLITYPHEVVRTRMRQQPASGSVYKYRGLIPTIRTVWVEEGIKAFYGGLSAHLMRVVPNAAVMFSIYEVALRMGSQTQVVQEGTQERSQQMSLRGDDEVSKE